MSVCGYVRAVDYYEGKRSMDTWERDGELLGHYADENGISDDEQITKVLQEVKNMTEQNQNDGNGVEQQKNETRGMRLNFEQVLMKGKRMYKFTFENVATKDKLPREYIEAAPYVYTDSGERFMFRDVGCYITGHSNGVIVSESTMNEIVGVAEKAGARLKKINDRIRDDKKNWVGKVRTFII